MSAPTFDWRIEIAPGANPDGDDGSWLFEDITARVRHQAGVSSSQGRPDEFGQTPPGTLGLTVDNRTGDFCPTNPLGQWYGRLGMNTPVRWRLRHLADTFARTASSGWGTSTYATGGTPRTWSTSGGAASDYSVSSAAGRHSLPATASARSTFLDTTSLLDVDMVFDVTCPAVATTAAIVTGAIVRRQDANNYYSLRAEFNPNTGGGNTVSAKITRTVGGVETSLGAPVVAGLLYSAGTTMRIRAQAVGSILRLKVWNSAGTEPATGWSHQAEDATHGAGSVGFRSFLVGGNTNTLPLAIAYANLTVSVDRACGFVPSWPPRWDRSGKDAWVPVSAAGVLRRLSQGKSPSYSPLRRSIQAGDTPLDYWPLEDGTDAQQGVSAIVGRPAMTTVGTVSFAAFTPPNRYARTWRFGTSPLPSFAAGGSVTAPVQAGGTGEWAVMVAAEVDAPRAAVTIPFLEWETPVGTYVRWQIAETSGGATNVTGFNAAGAGTTVLTTTSFGGFTNYQVDAIQNGGNVDIRLWVFGTLLDSTTLVGATLTDVARVTVNPTQLDVSGVTDELGRVFSVGHVRVYADNSAFDVPRYTDPDTGLNVYSLQGWSGEAAHNRINRLCDEEGVQLSVEKVSSEVATQLNAQGDGAFLDLVHAAEDADSGGVLFERGFGLAYQPRGNRYNAPVAMTLDFNQGHIAGAPEPTLDDQFTRNDWTIVRTSGSEARYEDTVHINGDGVGRPGHGRYDDSKTLDLINDSVLLSHASWRVWLGTSPDLRWPQLSWNLRAHPDLIDAWLACRPGSRIRVVHPPAQVGTDDIDVFLEGWAETADPLSWRVSANCSPARPWLIADVDGSQRVAADGSTLGAGISASATSFSLTSTATNGVWTTDPADYPLDVRIGGERVTLSGVSGTSSPQTATVSARAVNGVTRAWPAGTEVDVWEPAIVPL